MGHFHGRVLVLMAFPMSRLLSNLSSLPPESNPMGSIAAAMSVESVYKTSRRPGGLQVAVADEEEETLKRGR